MRRYLLILLFGTGVIAGYGAGFASIAHHAHHACDKSP